MTYREDFTLPAELLEEVSKQGIDILPELIQTHRVCAYRFGGTASKVLTFCRN